MERGFVLLLMGSGFDAHGKSQGAGPVVSERRRGGGAVSGGGGVPLFRPPVLAQQAAHTPFPQPPRSF